MGKEEGDKFNLFFEKNVFLAQMPILCGQSLHAAFDISSLFQLSYD
jgi:hypothetical protein